MNHFRPHWQFHRPILPIIFLLLAGCAEDPVQDIGESASQATFRVGDEVFRVRITNAETIEVIADVWAGTSHATIPNGALRRGSGEDGHNAPWNWHLDPEDIEMAELTIELCDGRPSAVEANLDELLTTVGRYCPWGAELIHLETL